MNENNEEEVTSIQEYVPFGFHIVESSNPEHGEFKIKSGFISLYNAITEEWEPIAMNYDGAPDPWGSSKNYEEEERSNHDWIGSKTIGVDGSIREEFFPQDAWQITDGWTEGHAIGLPGIYTMDKDWVLKTFNRVCDSCFIYTPKQDDECQNCGSKVIVKV